MTLPFAKPGKRKRQPRPGRLKGEELAELRRQCFYRDKYRCQHIVERGIYGLVNFICGEHVTWESGHMAHIVSRARGGMDRLDNVVTKCGRCHIGIEHAYGPSGVKPCPPK